MGAAWKVEFPLADLVTECVPLPVRRLSSISNTITRYAFMALSSLSLSIGLCASTGMLGKIQYASWE